MADLTLEAINRLLELGRGFQDFVWPSDADDVLILPAGMKVEDVSRFIAPKRIRAEAHFDEATSFAEYVNRFKTGDTLICASITDAGAQFVAHLDYHGAAPELKPAWGRHKAGFAPLLTREWTEWLGADRKAMDQVTFATWLEDNYQLFAEPAGADLLELVQTLEGSNEVRFSSSVRLQSGSNRINFDEDVTLKGQTSTKSGDLELPRTIKAAIAPFQGAAPVEVMARLKFRIESRKLSLWFETIAAHKIVRDAVTALLKEISERTKLVPLIGQIKV